VVEQGDQLLAGERALAGVGLRVGEVHRGVPLVHHLNRVDAEPLLTLRRPLVSGIDEVSAEGMDGLLIVTQRRALEVPDRPQVAEPLVDLSRCPAPWEGVAVPGERPHRLLPTPDR
jgi:hypothetical protein